MKFDLLFWILIALFKTSVRNRAEIWSNHRKWSPADKQKDNRKTEGKSNIYRAGSAGHCVGGLYPKPKNTQPPKEFNIAAASPQRHPVRHKKIK